jgi:hypothetical protein
MLNKGSDFIGILTRTIQWIQMSTDKKEKHSGLATLFDGVELKSFFINYLWFIIAVEILIFLVSFLGILGPDKGPFPWKFYFYVSFITPVAITFLLGVFILAFNQFIFGNTPAVGEDGATWVRKRTTAGPSSFSSTCFSPT